MGKIDLIIYLTRGMLDMVQGIILLVLDGRSFVSRKFGWLLCARQLAKILVHTSPRQDSWVQNMVPRGPRAWRCDRKVYGLV